jgi:hypothetical protein
MVTESAQRRQLIGCAGVQDGLPMAQGTANSRLRQAIGWLAAVTLDNAGGAVYGTVMIGVLFAAEDPAGLGYTDTIGAALIVLALYWLTSLYTYTLGVRLRTGEPLSTSVFLRSCLHELPILEGALLPLVVILVSWAAGASVNTAVTIATWTVAVTILFLEFLAGWRSRLALERLWVQAALGTLIGFAIIALKLLLH